MAKVRQEERPVEKPAGARSYVAEGSSNRLVARVPVRGIYDPPKTLQLSGGDVYMYGSGGRTLTVNPVTDAAEIERLKAEGWEFLPGGR